jgi:hypothetical protein
MMMMMMMMIMMIIIGIYAPKERIKENTTIL